MMVDIDQRQWLLNPQAFQSAAIETDQQIAIIGKSVRDFIEPREKSKIGVDLSGYTKKGDFFLGTQKVGIECARCTQRIRIGIFVRNQNDMLRGVNKGCQIVFHYLKEKIGFNPQFLIGSVVSDPLRGTAGIACNIAHDIVMLNHGPDFKL